MKRAVCICVAMILLTSVTAQGGPVSLNFDRSRVTFVPENHTAGYDDYEPTAAGSAILLGARTFYVRLGRLETIASIDCAVVESEYIGSFNLPEALTDIATASSPAEAERIRNAVPGECLGALPIFVTGECLFSGDRYVSLLVFPVTIDEQGNAVFNRSIVITIGGRTVAEANLLTEITGAARPDEYTARSALGDSEVEVVDYVIITTADLAEPLDSLAAYKTSTGYNTEVVLIDYITASFAGWDDAEKLRSYLIEFHAQGGRYVLLAGDETKLPIRYAYHWATDEVPYLGDQQICDLYFADLTGEWDVDDDGVWGERGDDLPDIIPELNVGRLPFNCVEEAANYVNKLIAYETNPGEGEVDYLDRAFFFSSDQMRDYSEGGQHGRIAAAYPEYFRIDTTCGVELDRGDDPAPYNAGSLELVDTLSTGYGIVNIISHGSDGTFDVRTSGYNHFPKSFFTTDTAMHGNGVVSNLAPNGRSAFYYSLACNNGGFDLDQPPFNQPNPNIVQTFLGVENRGAVAFVANSRWGWVGSSHLLQKAFFDSLFANPDRPAVEAMYKSKQRYYYVRDIVYGQNFYGDPTLRIYTDIPQEQAIRLSFHEGSLLIHVASGDAPVTGSEVLLSRQGRLVGRYQTDSEGNTAIDYDFSIGEGYLVSAVKAGYVIARRQFTPSIASDCDNDDGHGTLPTAFGLSQNYPNPFNPTTTIRFHLERRESVKLTVYNVLGRQVATLIDETLSAGSHEAIWTGTDDNRNAVASGVYFYRLAAGELTDRKKMVLMR